eukprot:TRINITY_DN20196_c0_g1_i1.p1 TRINITY_DN20196_c0_g1~~TRINITY_DN20196_c0_g1_i1.p1  ORF type:complete len:308 (+),score=54.19 TRINITY_DN20196_c0_g1_i1:61-984(+)
MSRRRVASHAGSWYSGDGGELSGEISALIGRNLVDTALSGRKLGAVAKAVIAPHAGLSYSGKTASHAYAKFAQSLSGVKRVFVLGPCHCEYFEDIRVSSFEVFAGPIHDLSVDQDINEDLIAKGAKQGLSVKYLNQQTDVDEHSIELQMPFLSYVLKSVQPDTKVVPIVVGQLDAASAKRYGKLLAPYYQDPDTRFVVSSDFCHWGSRFRYTYHYDKKTYPHIGDAVIAMDHEGMRLIEAQDVTGFDTYLETTRNTICGRVPIGILMEAMADANVRQNIDFVHYSQSSKCNSPADSSVSYAAAVVTM